MISIIQCTLLWEPFSSTFTVCLVHLDQDYIHKGSRYNCFGPHSSNSTELTTAGLKTPQQALYCMSLLKIYVIICQIHYNLELVHHLSASEHGLNLFCSTVIKRKHLFESNWWHVENLLSWHVCLQRWHMQQLYVLKVTGCVYHP